MILLLRLRGYEMVLRDKEREVKWRVYKSGLVLFWYTPKGQRYRLLKAQYGSVGFEMILRVLRIPKELFENT